MANCEFCPHLGTPSYKSPCSECLKEPEWAKSIPIRWILTQIQAPENAGSRSAAYSRLIEKWREIHELP